MSFIEVYKELMNFFTVFLVFLKYVANAEYMINSRPFATKNTLMILNNFLRIWN